MEPTDLVTDRYGAPKYAGQRMTKADFLRWESDDNYVYEYNGGILEPTKSARRVLVPPAITPEERLLITNREHHFSYTDAFSKGNRLQIGVDVWATGQQLYRPNVAYFGNQQKSRPVTDEQFIPEFVVEFLSANRVAQNYLRALREYFNTGVQVVWLVLPDDFIVYSYTSPKTVIIATDADLLSAAPALPDLQITVEELFRR